MASTGQANRFGSTNTPQGARVGGSGFTVFHWENQTVAFAQAVSVRSPQPVAQAVEIHPMDQQRPTQIITPVAITGGTIQFQKYEMFGSKIWDDIMATVDLTAPTSNNGNALPRYDDLAEIFLRLSSLSKPISCTKVITPPAANSTSGQFDGETYHNCVITDIRDDESEDVSRMEIIKSITVQYTYSTRV